MRGRFVDGQDFDYSIEDHPELGKELEGGWYVGHPVGNRFVTWKPGKPFPNSLQYSDIDMNDISK